MCFALIIVDGIHVYTRVCTCVCLFVGVCVHACVYVRVRVCRDVGIGVSTGV